MSAQCYSLPRRTSSERSCIQFLTISGPWASSLVADLTCVRLHVWRQFRTRTQIVSFLPRTRSPLSTQTASPHQPWAPSRLRLIYTGFSPGLQSGRRCRLAPAHLSSLARVRSPGWSKCSSSSFGSGAFVQDSCTHKVPKPSPPPRPSQPMLGNSWSIGHRFPIVR